MRKRLLQIILIAILIVIIEIPFTNSVKSAGPYENCVLQCQENYPPGSDAILDCFDKCIGPHEACMLQCQEDYPPGSYAILDCLDECVEIGVPDFGQESEPTEPTEPTEPAEPTETSDDETGFFIGNPLGETSTIGELLFHIVGFLIVLAIPISMILVVYAGFLYITSTGNEEKIKTAQKTLIWALVGFAVVLIARSVPTIITDIFSQESTTTEESE